MLLFLVLNIMVSSLERIRSIFVDMINQVTEKIKDKHTPATLTLTDTATQKETHLKYLKENKQQILLIKKR